VVRGKYAARYHERLRAVRFAADVSGAFADEAAVNDALREYLTWRQKREAESSRWFGGWALITEFCRTTRRGEPVRRPFRLDENPRLAYNR
jgi:hypothetical protein